MLDFYRPWEEVREQKFDGLVVTGAPIERLPFEEVKYWDELRKILDWSQTHVNQTLGLCWGGQAALHHFYGVPKYELPQKMFGVYTHRVVTPNSTLLRGFDDEFPVPVSRHTEVRREDLPKSPGMRVLAESDDRRQIYMFNHLEYDVGTLRDEYLRDLSQGEAIQKPVHYFPDDDPDRPPVNHWRSHAHLFVSNWINDIYQSSPADVSLIGTEFGGDALPAGE